MIEIFHAATGDERAELSRLARDGLLHPVLDGVYVSLDTSVDSDVRAAALGRLIPAALQDAGAVTGLEAAAWLLAGGREPAEIDMFLGSRPGRLPVPGLHAHEIRLDPRDVETVGHLRVTSPARTAADLCRARSTEEALAHLDRLRSATGLGPRAVLAVLERLAHHRGVPHGREVIDIWRARLRQQPSAVAPRS